MSASENNKLIAKNTLFLYMRMLLILGVNLFMVRIVLNTLGTEDYGINNVVGGIVTMLSFFTSTMVSTSQRFFAFEIGRKDYVRLNQYFNLTVLCYACMGIAVLLLAETVGLWFMKTQMVIPAARMGAAMWVYQFSIVTFILHIVMVPFNSVIIAREQMKIYAYISIIEVILKLAIVLLLVLFNVDKLKMYSILLCLVAFVTTSFYIIYSKQKFMECKLTYFWDKRMFLELVSYCGWSLFSALADAIKNQGINILLNIFFNPIVNAARAIAFQVSTAINQFVTNFYQAVRPQITKQYASGEKQEMMTLVFRSSRFCYYLILVFAIPILTEMPFILTLWLHNVPENTILFTRLVIVTVMIESISYPLMTAVSATGKIKLFQAVIGGLLILNLPLTYVFLKLGYPPEISMYLAMGIAIISQISRVLFMKKMHCMSIYEYLKNIILVLLGVTILSWVAPLIFYRNMEEGLLRLAVVALVSLISSILVIYAIGITKGERQTISIFIYNKTLSIIKR